MLRFLADECLNDNLVRGLRRTTAIDITRARDVQLQSKSDQEILAWAANADRIVLTHDGNTMIRFAYDRIAANAPMPGLILVPVDMSNGDAIVQIEFIVAAGEKADFAGQVRYLPIC